MDTTARLRLKICRFPARYGRYRARASGVSHHPEESGWDRRFISSDPVNNIVYDIHSDSQERPVVDTNALSPLHKAAYGGHDGKTKKLIQEGAALNERGPNGWTPLHMSAIGGHRLLSEYLLNEGADISIKDKSGRSAAKLGEIFGHEGLAKFLREEDESAKNPG